MKHIPVDIVSQSERALELSSKVNRASDIDSGVPYSEYHQQLIDFAIFAREFVPAAASHILATHERTRKLEEALRIATDTIKNQTLKMCALQSWMESYNSQCDPEQRIPAEVINEVHDSDRASNNALATIAEVIGGEV